MKKYEQMARADLIRRIKALEKGAPAAAIAFEHERVLHELQVHQTELETQNRELREAQLLVEVSRDRYADLYDFAPVGYVTLDEKGIIRGINLTAAGMLGVERTRLLGVHLQLHVAREDLALFREHLGRPLKPDQHVVTELRLLRKDPDMLPVLLQSTLVFDVERKGYLRRTAITDITARKQAEEALREKEQRYRALVDLSPDAIFINQHDRITFINPAGLRLFGATDLAQVLGKSLFDFFPEDHHDVIRKRIDSLLKSGGAWPAIEEKLVRLDGVVRFVEVMGAMFPVQGESSIQLILRDITERKHAAEALRIRSRQQQAVAEFGHHALAGRDFDRLIQDAVVLVPQILGVEFCKVLEVQPESGDFLLRAGTGWKAGCVGQATVSGGRGSHAGFTLLANGPVVVEDFSAEARFHISPLLAKHAVVSSVGVVIHGRGKPFGVLGADSNRRHSFSGDDVHFIQAIANVLAAAIDRRELEEELLKISDEERERIGRDLHDDLCQQLTGIEFCLEGMKERLASLPAAQEEAEKIGGFIRNAALRARTLARGLSPVHFEASGLMSALQELAANMTGLFRVPCEFRCKSPVLISNPSVATHLYRIAQEAISNAARHSRAKNIVVSLARSPAGAMLTIADDGIGCPAPILKSTGMGLRIMQYRSEMIGATLRIQPGARRGTIVTCECPPP